MNRYFNYKVNVSLPGIQNYGLTKYMNFLNTGEGTLTLKVKVVRLGICGIFAIQSELVNPAYALINFYWSALIQ